MKFSALKLIVIFLLIGAENIISQQIDSLLDIRDSKKYKTVVIGKQAWMAQNLNLEMPSSWTYENKAENGNKLGRLYEWEAAMKACPAGWHLPTDDEWKELEKFLGMSDVDLEKFDKWRGTDQATKLISDTALGFNIKMGGYRNPPSNYYLLDSQAFFWTSSLEYEIPWFRQIYSKSPQIFRRSRPKSWAFSVRCIKN